MRLISFAALACLSFSAYAAQPETPGVVDHLLRPDLEHRLDRRNVP